MKAGAVIAALLLAGCADPYIPSTDVRHKAAEAAAIAHTENKACKYIVKAGAPCNRNTFVVYTKPPYYGSAAIGGPLIEMPRKCEGLLHYSYLCREILAHEMAHVSGLDESGARYVGRKFRWY